jgi:hypothetical protein
VLPLIVQCFGLSVKSLLIKPHSFTLAILTAAGGNVGGPGKEQPATEFATLQVQVIVIDAF